MVVYLIKEELELSGIIIKIFAVGKRDWASIKVRLDDDSFINMAGTIPGPAEGYPILAKGEYVTNNFGKQFKVRKATVVDEISEEGLVGFLENCIYAIGHKRAIDIVQMFGKDTMKIILFEPERLTEIKGITSRQLDRMTESMEENKNYLELFDFTNGKVTFTQAKNILRKYGDETINKLKENPYRLMYDIKGFGYIITDKLAIATGIETDSIFRIEATINYVLDDAEDSNGHCFLDKKMLQKKVIALLSKHNPEYKDKFEDKFEEAISCCEKNGHIFVENERVYKKKTYIEELLCAREIKKRLFDKVDVPNIKNLDKEIELIKKNGVYNKEQIQGIRNGLSSKISIITGGAGTGKTSMIKEIIRIAKKSNIDVILCAPTGKAAMRLKEACNHPASTIHRQNPRPYTLADCENELYQRISLDDECNSDEVDTINDSIVVIDEWSMVGIHLATRAFLTFKEASSIIFVGDPNQLASIEPGKLLKDMVECEKIPTTKLVECYRNEGAIVENANKINDGRTFSSLVFNNQFSFIESEKEDMLDNIMDQYDIIKKKGIDFSDICVISPMTASSTSGVAKINEKLRNYYNPYTKEKTFGAWRIGDRVMNTKNNYDIPVKNGLKTIRKGIFNGDIGTIIDAQFNPDAEEEEDRYFYTISLDDEENGIIIVNVDEMNKFILAYAMTIHKSQGSEYPYVIVSMNTDHWIMLKRNLFYTAVTRAKTKVILVGKKQAFQTAIRTKPDDKRNTTLIERINK